MDKLQECAKSFEKLLDKKYHIVIGRKGKSVEIELTFEVEDFHHLIGLHKLKDIEALSGKRGKVFRDVLSGRISLSSIERSPHFSQIANRIEPFSDLEKVLDNMVIPLGQPGERPVGEAARGRAAPQIELKTVKSLVVPAALGGQVLW